MKISTAAIRWSALVFLVAPMALVAILMDGIHIYAGSDIYRYAAHYLVSSTSTLEFLTRPGHYELGYELAVYVVSRSGVPFDYFIVTWWLLVVSVFFFASGRLSNSTLVAVASSAVFVFWPLSDSYQFVIVRQSLAISLTVLGLTFLATERWRTFIIISLFAILLHYSAAIPAAIAVSVYITRRSSSTPFLYIFATCVMAYVADLPLHMTAILSRLASALSSYAEYGSLTSIYTVGFKLPFLLFSSVGAVLAWALRRTALGEMLMRYYMLMSSTYMLFSGFPYYDRIAAYSWALIPILFSAIVLIVLRRHVFGRALRAVPR